MNPQSQDQDQPTTPQTSGTPSGFTVNDNVQSSAPVQPTPVVDQPSTPEADAAALQAIDALESETDTPVTSETPVGAVASETRQDGEPPVVAPTFNSESAPTTSEPAATDSTAPVAGQPADTTNPQATPAAPVVTPIPGPQSAPAKKPVLLIALIVAVVVVGVAAGVLIWQTL